ncbi:hypothetical protein [Halovivax gelatinilyticus]|uniref:hypothetical protein n=1 Tax=Halovivax gelatinilyticus TaxID=2961597 RepID=UPI0020CA310D|nr:hypothetical protein [Halovivax gelatinilyticus]
MGVRPPTNNDDSEPETIEFGIAAVDARLKETDLTFPADVARVEQRLGPRPIPFDASGNSVSVDDALAETGLDRFDSRQHLMNELHDVFEEYRATHTASVFGRVRSMLPF